MFIPLAKGKGLSAQPMLYTREIFLHPELCRGDPELWRGGKLVDIR